MGNKNVTSALRAGAAAQASLEPSAPARSGAAADRLPLVQALYYLRTDRIAGGVKTNKSLEPTPIVSTRHAHSWHAGCGAAVNEVVPAASHRWMFTGPVRLNYLR